MKISRRSVLAGGLASASLAAFAPFAAFAQEQAAGLTPMTGDVVPIGRANISPASPAPRR